MSPSTHPRHLQNGNRTGEGRKRLEKDVHNVYKHNARAFLVDFLAFSSHWHWLKPQFWQNRVANGNVGMRKFVDMQARMTEFCEWLDCLVAPNEFRGECKHFGKIFD